MDEQRLTCWAEAIEAAVERALRDIVSRYPFEPDEHTVGPPASESELAMLRQRLPWIPDDLLAVARWVGEVSLPDIANGYFLFSPRYIQTVLDHNDGIPDRIGEPFDEDVDVVIFGADGGGARYAIAVGDTGAVYRLRECGYKQGTYSGSAVSSPGFDGQLVSWFSGVRGPGGSSRVGPRVRRVGCVRVRRAAG
ncbi:SMI1/KNR4 family protein, partial [Micromonospora endophytica]|uniref:SMI1/KNR4 family protein n=2 Tax=Micromonospora endophytica TaxID=515350 RepID=UPI0011B6B5B0